MLYFENKTVNVGKWAFKNSKKGLSINLLGNKTEYDITEFTANKLKLTVSGTADFLEFVEV